MQLHKQWQVPDFQSGFSSELLSACNLTNRRPTRSHAHELICVLQQSWLTSVATLLQINQNAWNLCRSTTYWTHVTLPCNKVQPGCVASHVGCGVSQTCACLIYRSRRAWGFLHKPTWSVLLLAGAVAGTQAVFDRTKHFQLFTQGSHFFFSHMSLSRQHCISNISDSCKDCNKQGQMSNVASLWFLSVLSVVDSICTNTQILHLWNFEELK